MQIPCPRPRTFLRLSQVTLAVVVLNVVSGAAVRLTDSGLGCPDWPTCSRRQLTPPLSFHPAVEFGNRMIVTLLVITTVVCLAGALARTPRRRDLVWLSAGLVAGVLGEAGIGAVVVYSKLNPYAVMTHFIVGMALLADATVLALRAGRSGAPGTFKVSRRVVLLGRVMVGVLAVVLVAGTATTGAGPHAGGAGAKRLPVPLADMARTHSAIVLGLIGLTLGMLYLLDQERAAPSVVQRCRFLIIAMVVQGFIGYTQYFTHLPVLLVGFHVFGACVVWVTMLWFYDGLSYHPAEVPAPQPATQTPSGDVLVTARSE